MVIVAQLPLCRTGHWASWQIGETRDMRALALNVASAVLFGSSPEDRENRLGSLMERWIASCFSPGVWFFQWDLPVLPFRRLLYLAEELEAEIRRMIHQQRQKDLGEDILSVLIRARNEDSQTMSEDELVGEISVVFAAAHETNTVALTWLLFLLSQHPKILSDLVDELEGELRGDAPRADQFDRLPLLGSPYRRRHTLTYPSAVDPERASVILFP